jgi:hypothetical protein
LRSDGVRDMREYRSRGCRKAGCRRLVLLNYALEREIITTHVSFCQSA